MQQKNRTFMNKNAVLVSRGGFEPGCSLHNPFILKVSSVYSPIVRQNKIPPFATIVSLIQYKRPHLNNNYKKPTDKEQEYCDKKEISSSD